VLDRAAVLVAQQVLEQDAQREGQPPGAEAGLLQRGQTVNLHLALAHLEDRATPEAVRHAAILRVPRSRCRDPACVLPSRIEWSLPPGSRGRRLRTYCL